jgi:hypothetical protein
VKGRLSPPQLLLSSLLLFGCAATKSGRFDARGFRAADDAYTIRWVEQGGGLLGADWHVDNFSYENGKPAKPKTKGKYETELDWPAADGSTLHLSTTLYDLRLSHVKSNGVIWARVLPLPPEMNGKRLGVVAENWANDLSGTVFDAPLLASRRSKRLATKIVESEATRVAGHAAQAVTFEVVDLDQRELDANAPRTKVRALFVEGKLRKLLEGHDRTYDVSGCLFIGYANDAATFDQLRPTFDRLLGGFEIPAR